MTDEDKRIGRPFKEPQDRKRVSLGLKVTPRIKQIIEQRARESGRTQSQEAEFMMERALLFDSIFDEKSLDVMVKRVAILRKDR